MPAVAVLIVAGFHVPLMPLLEIAGNAGAAAFWHNGPMALNVGVTCGSIVMLSVVVVAHWPADGVNVYVVVPAVAVLIVAGFQVPVIPLFDVVGSVGAVLFWQSGPICVNVGIICGLTVMLRVAVVAHCPADGVNV